VTELVFSPDACEAAWKTWSSLLLSAPANRIARKPTFPLGSSAIATLTSAAVRPRALSAFARSAFELWPRKSAPFMLSFVSFAPPNVLGSSASRFVSSLGSVRLGIATLAAGAVLAAGAMLASGDGDAAMDGSTDGATEAAAAGGAVGDGVAEQLHAATKMARAADAASGAR
jgi:hypothetical protein